jgi:hypothetical protein
MSVLRAIEGKIEGLFEGVFGRAFRSHVQPVELARKLTKEMDEYRSVSVSRVYVPNEYTVFLAPSDREQFAAYEGSLIGELQEYVMEHARREGYSLVTPARVLMESDDDLARGEFGIACRVVEQADGPPSLPSLPPPAFGTDGSTAVYRAEEPPPPAPAPPAPREPDTVLTVDGRDVPIPGDRMLIGRSRDCDLSIVDTNISRRHCEIVRENDLWFVADLGSTNGTELNGQPIVRAELKSGDRITIGASDIVFSRRDAT